MADETLDDELLRLDKIWEREREQLLISGQRPTVRTSLLTLIVGLVGGGTLVVLSCLGKFPYGAMIGPVMLLGGLLFGGLGIQKAKQYDLAEKVYYDRRDALERQKQNAADSPTSG